MSKYSTLLGTSAIAVAMLAAPAVAQDYPEDEIFVTATKRTQTLQDTPVAVSVTTADIIEKAQILDIKDLQAVVPTLRVTQLQSSQNTNFLIRGFGNGANNAGIEPAVGVFIDGVYRSRAAAQIGDLPKLERVEVLSGPQSTLYGKNSSAGVISIVSAKPSFEGQGYVEAGYGNYDAMNVKGYMTDGTNDGEFAVSIGGSYSVRDGYGESLTGQDDLNDRDRWSLRAQALWQPTDNLEFRVIGDVSSINEQCCTIGFVDAINGTAPNGTAINGLNVIGAITAPTPFGLGGVVGSPFDYTVPFNGPADNYVDDTGISFHADWDLGNFAITSITSARKNEGGYDTEVDYTSAAIVDSVEVGNDIDTFTQELRIASTGDNRFNWLLGGFYFNESIESDSTLVYGDEVRAYVDLLAGGPAVLGAIEAFNGYTPGTEFFQAGQGTSERFTQDNDAFSIFGQADFEVTDKLTLTAGGNYTEDKKDVTFAQTANTDTWASIDLFNPNAPLTTRANPGITAVATGAIAAAFGNPADPIYQAFAGAFGGLPLTAANFTNLDTIVAMPGTQAVFVENVGAGVASGLGALQFLPPLTGFSDSSKDDDFTYTLRAAYEVNDDLNVYASYSTGFKATSWNLSRDTRPVVAPAGANANEGTGTRLAGPEESKVLEFGVKAKFDNAGINLAVFDQTISNFQGNLFQGTGFVLTSAGKQSVRGVEWDSYWRPLEPLTLSLAGTYLDPNFDEFTGAPGPFGTVIDRTGDRPNGIHEWSIVAGLLYEHDFGNGTEGYLRGSYLYESDVQIVPNLTTIDALTAQGFNIAATANGLTETTREVSSVDASAGLSFDNGFGVQLWAKNLFNDEYLMSAFPGVAQPGVFYGYPNPPRTYGVALRKEF